MPKKVIETQLLMQPIAHFSHAVRVGPTIHLGAMAGVDETRRLVGAIPGMLDIKAQCSKTLDNLETVLGLLQAHTSNLTRVRAYLSDTRDIADFEQVFTERFPDLLGYLAIGVSYGFPLYQAAIELDAEAQIVDRGGVDESRRYYVARPVDDNGGWLADSAEDQVKGVFRHLFRQTEAANFRRSDIVALEISLVDSRLTEIVEKTIHATFPDSVPCCTVVVSPLANISQKLEVQALCVAGGGESIEHPRAGSAISAAPPAKLIGDELYISAQCNNMSDGASTETQTLKVWESIYCLLEAVGLETTDILRTTNVLTDWRDYAAFNRGYGASVVAPYPPRTTILGGLLTPGARMQTQAIAHRHAGNSIFLSTP